MRRGASTLDAQLLNPLALRLEEIQLRLKREQGVADINNVPLNIDNQGTYYKLQIPDTYEFQADSEGNLIAPGVRAFTAEQRWKILSAYDDTLTVGSAIALAGEGGSAGRSRPR